MESMMGFCIADALEQMGRNCDVVNKPKTGPELELLASRVNAQLCLLADTLDGISNAAHRLCIERTNKTDCEKQPMSEPVSETHEGRLVMISEHINFLVSKTNRILVHLNSAV